MQQPYDLTLAKIEQAIVAIETQMTLRATQIEQLGGELSASRANLEALNALLVKWDAQRAEVINRTFLRPVYRADREPPSRFLRQFRCQAIPAYWPKHWRAGHRSCGQRATLL